MPLDTCFSAQNLVLSPESLVLSPRCAIRWKAGKAGGFWPAETEAEVPGHRKCSKGDEGPFLSYSLLLAPCLLSKINT